MQEGIELYYQAKEIMDIDVSVKNLGSEINELYQFAALVKEKESSHEMGKLTQVATYFLPATLVVGIFGMNTFPKESIESIPWLIFSLILVFLPIFFFQRYTIEFSKFLDKWNIFNFFRKKDKEETRFSALSRRFMQRKRLVKKGKNE